MTIAINDHLKKIKCKYKQNSLKVFEQIVPKSACIRAHFLLLILVLIMGINSPLKTLKKWYP